MNRTSNSLPPLVRKETIGVLNHTVAELFDLFVRIKQVYWNVRGVSFIGLHRFLDEFALETLEHIDAIAEHAMALGGTVQSANHLLGKNRKPSSLIGIPNWLLELAEVNARYSEHAHTAAGKLTDVGDCSTADLLTFIARGLDQRFWMLETHIDQQSFKTSTQRCYIP